MKRERSISNLSNHFKGTGKPFLHENRIIIAPIHFLLLFFCYWTLVYKAWRSRTVKVKKCADYRQSGRDFDRNWFTVIYILLQGANVCFCICIKRETSFFNWLNHPFIKRNFISIFLPAGEFLHLAFLQAKSRVKELKKPKFNFASSLYGFIGNTLCNVVAMYLLSPYAFYREHTLSGELSRP